MSEQACEVWFYHLERTGLDQALPELLEKTLQKGWKAIVRSSMTERIDHLDGWLWSYRDESFLPHGTARDGHASAHPIYLTAGDDNPNEAHIRFLVDGAMLADASPYVRVAYVFAGRDQDAVARARAAWQEAKARGDAVSYWQQDADGRWQQKA